MARAESLDEFDQAWGDFLMRIEGVWRKSAGEFANRSYEPWHGGYTLARKVDPLLKYVKQAHEAREHTLRYKYTVSRVSGGVMIRALPGKKLHIEHITIKSTKYDRAIENWGVKPEVRVALFEDGVNLLPAHSRGVRTDPPTRHMGKPLVKKGPLTIAEAALKYYKAFLDMAERRFKS